MFARDPGGRGFEISACHLPGNSFGQAAHMHVSMSPCSIIQYWPMGVMLFGWEDNSRPGGK